MKFGEKIYTYKDVDEAKALIGKKVILGDDLYSLSTTPEMYRPTELVTILEERSYLFCDVYENAYQFVREIIEDEPEVPKYRPYKDCTEMIEDFYNKLGFKGKNILALPPIWVKFKPMGSRELIHCFFTNEVMICDQTLTMSKLFTDYEYLDGTPCGVLEEEQ